MHATAQSSAPHNTPQADSTLLSEQVEGSCCLRRTLISNAAEADYTVRYRINLATLNAALADNSAELKELETFLGNVQRDTLMKIRAIEIIGYASPDGPETLNMRLAKQRAADFKQYADRKYNLSKRFDVSTRAVAESWAMSREAVAASQIPERQVVLKILAENQSAATTEQRLKHETAAWNYLKREILPSMRRVEVAIHYDSGQIVEQRIPIHNAATQACKPEEVIVVREVEEVVCDPCNSATACGCDGCCRLMEESVTGIIVEMPE